MRQTNLRATAPLDLRASGPTAQIHIKGHRGPAPLEPAAGVMSRRCWDRTRTRPTGVYTPLDRTTRTALPTCTCLDPQPLARDPAGAGGVAWAKNQGWIGLQLSQAGTQHPSLQAWRNLNVVHRPAHLASARSRQPPDLISYPISVSRDSDDRDSVEVQLWSWLPDEPVKHPS
jgi:hypothetical protein